MPCAFSNSGIARQRDRFIRRAVLHCININRLVAGRVHRLAFVIRRNQ